MQSHQVLNLMRFFLWPKKNLYTGIETGLLICQFPLVDDNFLRLKINFLVFMSIPHRANWLLDKMNLKSFTFTVFRCFENVNTARFAWFAPIITFSRHTHKLLINVARSETDFGCNARAEPKMFHVILKIKVRELRKVIPDY